MSSGSPVLSERHRREALRNPCPRRNPVEDGRQPAWTGIFFVNCFASGDFGSRTVSTPALK